MSAHNQTPELPAEPSRSLAAMPCSPSFDSRAKDAGLPYCMICGGKMRPNVPRLGWDAGAVHDENSSLECPIANETSAGTALGASAETN